MKIEDAIKKRKSVRRYSEKKPDWRKIIKAIDMARYAPMAGNIFSLRFMMIQDRDKIVGLKQACQQDFVGKSKYVVVVVSDEGKVKKFYDKKGEVYMRQQAGAAIENFLLGLTWQGLVGCWVGYFVEKQIKRILDIPEGYTVEAVIPIGIETKVMAKPKKDKVDLDTILYFDKWKQIRIVPKTMIRLESS